MFSIALSDMSHQIWQSADAARLKSLREKSEIEANNFARLTSISTTQLQQLEGEDDSAFYSPLIKYQVGKKLLNLFGEKPTAEQSVTPQHTNEKEVDAHDTAVIELNDEQQARTSLERIAEISNRDFNPPLHKAFGTSIKLCWEQHFIFSCSVLVLVMFLIGNHFLKAPLNGISQKNLLKNRDLIRQSGATRIPEPNKDQVLPSPDRSTASAPIALAASAVMNTATSIKIESPTRTSECDWTEAPTTLKSPQPTKSAEYIYFVAMKDITACVIDQNKQITTHILKIGQTQTVNGKAPFRVYSEQMADLKIYFQGYRIIIPSKVNDVLLTETPLQQ